MTDHSLPRIIEVSDRNGIGPRVLLVRLSAVGDCVQTMPLACAIRDHWPDAHLTWVVEKGAAPLVEVNDAVDRVMVLPKGFATSLRTLAWLRGELQRRPFDVALDPQGLSKSGIVSWLSNAKRRIGFARPAAREINPWFQTDVVTSRSAARVDRYLELLAPLGIERSTVRFGLKIPTVAIDKAAQVASLPELRRGFVVLNPGAGWASKRWPVERYAEVARSLAKQNMASLVVWGGAQERRWAEEIVSQSAGAAWLAPETTLLELAGILHAARLFVGSDTGPLHLAAAVGTPCVGLFGASSAANCGPHGSDHVCLQEALDESSGRKRSAADNWAMRQISAESVYAACSLALAAAQAANREFERHKPRSLPISPI